MIKKINHKTKVNIQLFIIAIAGIFFIYEYLETYNSNYLISFLFTVLTILLSKVNFENIEDIINNKLKKPEVKSKFLDEIEIFGDVTNKDDYIINQENTQLYYNISEQTLSSELRLKYNDDHRLLLEFERPKFDRYGTKYYTIQPDKCEYVFSLKIINISKKELLNKINA